MPPKNLSSLRIVPTGGADPLDELLQNLEVPLWRSLFRSIDEYVFPKRLPPLVLTSKPEPVKSIWEPPNYKKGAFGSFLLHSIVLSILIAGTVIGVKTVTAKKPEVVTEIIVAPYIPTVGKNRSGGGGGGGDRDKLRASLGSLPKPSDRQLTPPVVVVRNEKPKLPEEPTVVAPQIHLEPGKQLGDIQGILGPPSNGIGSGGGIGSGSGGGVGSGRGPGVGPGWGGGIGGGAYRVGGDVSPPKILFNPDPEFSEEARKAKYQGTVVLSIVVGTDGRAHEISVIRTLGMGLDEKAMEAIKTWKFDPGTKEGKPVAVAVNVEVTFRLY